MTYSLPVSFKKLLVFSLVLHSACLPLQAHAALLQGNVEHRHGLHQPAQPGAPKISADEDPFSSGAAGDDQLLPETAQVPGTGTAQPSGTRFSLDAEQTQSFPNWTDEPSPAIEPADKVAFEGVPAQPTPDNLTRQAAPAADPDESPEMQLAWDAWHQRVAQAIFGRFNFFAKAAFHFCPPLRCRVSYVVTCNGVIKDVQLTETSNNMFFNLLVGTVLKSINGDTALLRFPEGSRRTQVQKCGLFLNNYGRRGFSYTTGDREVLSQQTRGAGF